jgi:hypothetical protein
MQRDTSSGFRESCIFNKRPWQLRAWPPRVRAVVAMSAAGLPDPQASPKRALQGVLALAVSDDLIKKSPARADTVAKPGPGSVPKRSRGAMTA